MTARGKGADYGLGLVRFPRPSPLLVLWRWRYELGLAVVAALGAVLLARRVGALWTVHTGLALLTLVATVPVLRRWAVRRAWCVVTPHRVRTACKHAWVHSRTGRVPAVLWTAPVAEGERVLLWCRPGTSAEDLEAARPVLTATCWARAVRVEQDPGRAQLIRLTVVRAEDQRDLPPATAA